MLSSETSKADDKAAIVGELRAERLSLLYLTPDKVVKSKRLLGLLETLDGSGRLGRFVVDDSEAPCCATMGHDLRPDYRQLQPLPSPRCPLIACTATATLKV
jgi:ATP-dependent DNA helicase Q1